MYFTTLVAKFMETYILHFKYIQKQQRNIQLMASFIWEAL